jgi:Cu(I)/Ag(I) efflux system membrane protein CusA/SilA
VERGLLLNLLFVVLLVGGILSLFTVIRKRYKRTLRWCLDHKVLFLTLPLLILALGLFSWRSLGREFMPPLDEGSFLYMPTTMPHASLGETLDILQKQDLSMSMIPELETVVGKIGRAETALDPAPLSMVETVIQYHPEFLQDEKGRRLRFAHDRKERDLFRNVEGGSLLAPDGEPYTVQGRFKRDEEGRLVPDRRGRPFRLWRPELDPALNSGRKAWTGIQEPDDIWSEVLVATEIPGSTSAPKLQPIQTRLVMLQSGMRAPLGIKIQGPDLESMESFALSAEEVLRTSSAVNAATVNADRVVGKPYLEIHLLREDMARYGLSVARVQDTIEIALGGRPLTRTLEGRESYPVRLRYARERRDSFEAIGDLLVDTPSGARIPLAQISDIQYRRGPQVIKSEDGFLVSYLLFSGRKGLSEVEVVEECRDLLESKIADGSLPLPAGVHYRFAGTYENQLRASARLRLLVPLSLVLIFALLYLQFRSVAVALMVFSGVAVAWSGGFLMLGFYGLEFLPDFLRDMLHLRTVNLSVAVWVGFLALFGIATDDGVLMATYLRQGFQSRQAENREEVRKRVIEGASLRVRPALMTTATTLIALLPILSSTGRGSDIMIPMAIPVFGGMVVALATLFMVPVLYSLREEKRLSR